MTGRDGLGARQALRLSLAPFAAAKAVTLVVIFLAVWQHGHGTGVPGWQEVREAFARWDGQNYLAIATSGYPPDANLTPGAPGHLWGFFPGYPILVRIVGFWVRDAILAGILASAACELAALAFIAALVTGERDIASARFATWLVALAPFGVFFSVLFTESAFVAAAAASLHLARRGRFGVASVAGALAIAVRVTGLVLIPVILIEYVRQRGRRLRADLFWVAVVPLPLLAFLLYARHRTGDAFAYYHVQQSASFHRTLSSPLTGLATTFGQVVGPGNDRGTTYTFGVELVCGVAGGLGCLLLWLWRRVGARIAGHGIPASLSVYATGVWLLGVAQPYWLGIGRYELAMVPLVLPVADIVARRPQWATGVLAVSGGLMLYLTTIYAQGAFVA